MATQVWINIGSGNGLLPDGTKPLLEPMLTISKVQWHSSEGSFKRDISAINHKNSLQNYFSKISFKSPRGNELIRLFTLFYDDALFSFQYEYCCICLLISSKMWALLLSVIVNILIVVYWNLCINSLWPSYAIRWYKTGSTLALVMVWSLMAPCHYLNQCWLIINKVLWHSTVGSFTGNAPYIHPWYMFEDYQFKIKPRLPEANELIHHL